jgi:hypothetical protein
MSAVDRIAEALGEHASNMRGECDRCGVTVDGHPRALYEHMAAVIAALPDVAIVALPKPDDFGRWLIEGTDLDVRNTWNDGLGDTGASVEIRMDSIRRGGTMAKTYEISVAPDLAAALLAAARAAGDPHD